MSDDGDDRVIDLTWGELKSINSRQINLKEKIAELEKWKDKSWNMHQEMAQEILPNQLELLEKEISELKESHEFSKEYNTIKRGKIKEVLRKLGKVIISAFTILQVPDNRIKSIEDELEKLDGKDSNWSTKEHMEIDLKNARKLILQKDGEKDGIVRKPMDRSKLKVGSADSKPSEPNYDGYICEEEKDVFKALGGDQEALGRILKEEWEKEPTDECGIHTLVCPKCLKDLIGIEKADLEKLFAGDFYITPVPQNYELKTELYKWLDQFKEKYLEDKK